MSSHHRSASNNTSKSKAPVQAVAPAKTPSDIAEDSQPMATSHSGGCFVRLFWMAIGNLILVLALIGIFQRHTPWTFTSIDVIYWLTMLSLPTARFVDIRYFHGETADNRPATMADWRRYAASVLAVAGVLWAGVHLFSS